MNIITPAILHMVTCNQMTPKTPVISHHICMHKLNVTTVNERCN